MTTKFTDEQLMTFADIALQHDCSIADVVRAGGRAVFEIEAEREAKAQKARDTKARELELPMVRASIRSLERTRPAMADTALGRTFTASEQAQFDAVPERIALGHRLIALLEYSTATPEQITNAREKFLTFRLPASATDDSQPVHLEAHHYPGDAA